LRRLPAGIDLSRIEPVLTGRQIADHGLGARVFPLNDCGDAAELKRWLTSPRSLNRARIVFGEIDG
jgi:hypothetical protein